MGYRFWLEEEKICHRCEITIVCQEEVGWHIERATNYGPDMVSFTITEVWKKWYIVRAYVPPNDQASLQWLEQTQ